MKNFYKYTAITLLIIAFGMFIFALQQRQDAIIKNKETEVILKVWANYIDSVKVKTSAYKDTIEILRQELKSKTNK